MYGGMFILGVVNAVGVGSEVRYRVLALNEVHQSPSSKLLPRSMQKVENTCSITVLHPKPASVARKHHLFARRQVFGA